MYEDDYVWVQCPTCPRGRWTSMVSEEETWIGDRVCGGCIKAHADDLGSLWQKVKEAYHKERRSVMRRIK